MTTPAAITTYLSSRYPVPPPDPTWVSECCAALVDDGQAATRATVEEQYLYADLGAATLPARPGTSLPTAAEGARLHNPDPGPRGRLFTSTPVVVQIHAISEVGASAFSLKTTVEARRDVIQGKNRIRRMGDDDEDVEDPTEKKGPPPYPRHMLALEVSDGRTAVRAIEYRSIPELVLGQTPLGTKLLLHNVRCLRGTLLLEPANTTVLGGAVDALEHGQPEAFINGLEARLTAARTPTPAAFPAAATATRRRTLPIRNASTNNAPAQPRGLGANNDAGRAARLAAIQAAREEATEAAPSSAPTRTTRRTGATTRAAAVVESDYDDSFEVDDSFIQHIDAATAAATGSRTRAGVGSAGGAGTRPAKRARGEPDVIEISDSD